MTAQKVAVVRAQNLRFKLMMRDSSSDRDNIPCVMRGALHRHAGGTRCADCGVRTVGRNGLPIKPVAVRLTSGEVA